MNKIIIILGLLVILIVGAIWFNDYYEHTHYFPYNYHFHIVDNDKVHNYDVQQYYREMYDYTSMTNTTLKENIIVVMAK